MKKSFIISGPGPMQTGLNSHRGMLEAPNFRFRKKRVCTMCEAKTKILISCAATAQSIHVYFCISKKQVFMMRLVRKC